MIFLFKQQEQDPTNLYIANLPPFWSEQNLEQLFSQHGIVISTRILRDAQGQSRCVGFARYECDNLIWIRLVYGNCMMYKLNFLIKVYSSSFKNGVKREM